MYRRTLHVQHWTLLALMTALVSPTYPVALAAVMRVNSVVTGAGADAVIRHAGTRTFIKAEAGAELIDGDALRTGAHDVSLLTCTDSTSGPVDTTYSLSPGIEVAFSGGTLPRRATSALAKSTPCTLPIDDRSLPANLDDSRVRESLEGTWETRLHLLSEAGRQRLLELLQPQEDILKTHPKNLLALLARARHFENAGLAGDAIRAYLGIFRLYPQAGWASRSASRLTAQLLPLANIKAAVIPPPEGVDPGNYPRRAAGKDAPTREGIIAPRGKTFALLIGISTYPPEIGVDNLKYAEADASLFRKYLESERGGRVTNIKVLNSSNATASAVRNGLEDLVKGHASGDNTLILFVAAHGYYGCVDDRGVPAPPGCPDTQKEPFILTIDTSAEAARSTGLPMREFERLISQNAYRFGRVLVYVDVCHSGVIPWLRDRTAPPPDAVQMNFQPQLGSLGLMMASSQNPNSKELEYAWESDQLHHGIFTYYLLSAVAGEVQAKTNYVLFRDLFTHVREQVSGATKEQQIPSQSLVGQQLAVIDNADKHDFSVPPPDLTAGKAVFVKSSVKRDPSASPAPAGRSRGGEPRLPIAAGNAPEFVRNLPSGPLRDRFAALFTTTASPPKVALEDAGRQIILTYLQGDQVPQTREDFEFGAKVFEAALQFSPGTAANESRRLFCEGRVAIFDKRYEQAREFMEGSIRLDPTHGYAYNGLGIALLEQLPDHPEPEFLNAAVQAFEDAYHLEPHWAYPLHNLALVYAQKGDDDRAIESYRAAIRIAPAYSYLPYNLGLLHERRGESALAEKDFQLALKRAQVRAKRLGVFPQFWRETAAPLNALATLYLNEGRTRAASRQLDLARQADPRYVPAMHNTAILLMGKGRRDEAILLWRFALAIDPEYMPARLGLAEALGAVGDFDHAALEYREILDRAPGYLAARHALALILVSMRRLGEALGELKALPGVAAESQDIASLIAGKQAATSTIRKALGNRR